MVHQKSQILFRNCVRPVKGVELFLANKQHDNNVVKISSIGNNKRQTLFLAVRVRHPAG